MDPQFWHDRWQLGEIGFHEGSPNALMRKHFAKAKLAKGSRVFVPLCGKSQDLLWLRDAGMHVVGIELSAVAVQDFFKEAGLLPKVDEVGPFSRYRAGDIEILCGDVFELTQDILGHVDAVYDRAALVALPEALRMRYVAHVPQITGEAPYLLVTFEYDQTIMDGPPFSIGTVDVGSYFSGLYAIDKLETVALPTGLKGRAPAIEHVFLMTALNKA